MMKKPEDTGFIRPADSAEEAVVLIQNQRAGLLSSAPAGEGEHPINSLTITPHIRL